MSPLWEEIKIYDQVSLVMQLLDLFSKGTKDSTRKLVYVRNTNDDEFVKKDVSLCGFKNEETLTELRNNKVFKSFRKINKAVLPSYSAKIDWKNLQKYAEKLHDLEAVDSYALERLKKSMFQTIFEITKKEHSNEFVVTEKILGTYFDNPGLAQKLRREDSPDTKAPFLTVLRALEQEKKIQLLEIAFDFRKLPLPAKEMDFERNIPIGEEIEFFPADHCFVNVKVTDVATLKRVFGTTKSTYLGKPKLFEKQGCGYLQYGSSKPVKIGKASSKHWKLLAFTFDALGAERTTPSVFEVIANKKDLQKSKSASNPTTMLSVIEYANKELQKGNKLKGRLAIVVDEKRNTVKATFV